MQDCHTLVVSDIHLGSKVCRREKILELISTTHFKTLIINGDLFDSDSQDTLTQKDWEILSTLSDIAKNREIILVRGNHGRGLDKFAEKMGIEVKDSYAFMAGKNKFLCLHGDEFDIFVKHLPHTTKVFMNLYSLVQKFGGKKQTVSMLLKRFSKKILRISVRQQEKALEQGALQGASTVICSHTHLPLIDRQNEVHFINSGSFCETICNYVSISKAGFAELKEI